jgi:hypothetical protein
VTLVIYDIAKPAMNSKICLRRSVVPSTSTTILEGRALKRTNPSRSELFGRPPIKTNYSERGNTADGRMSAPQQSIADGRATTASADEITTSVTSSSSPSNLEGLSIRDFLLPIPSSEGGDLSSGSPLLYEDLSSYEDNEEDDFAVFLQSDGSSKVSANLITGEETNPS